MLMRGTMPPAKTSCLYGQSVKYLVCENKSIFSYIMIICLIMVSKLMAHDICKLACRGREREEGEGEGC